METAESKLVPNTVQGSANAFDPKKLTEIKMVKLAIMRKQWL